VGGAAFLINHSYSYSVAATASWLEYATRAYFFPAFKSDAIALIGEATRARGVHAEAEQGHA
jgi:hypothetical protein